MANYPFYQPPMQPMYGQAAMYQNPYMGQPVAAPMPQQMPQTTVPVAGNVAVQTASQPGFVCRPVASQEEAKAVPTDFSGNMLVMTDLSHGAIYTKVLDPVTGSAQFAVYQRAGENTAQQEQAAASVVQQTDYAPYFEDMGQRLEKLSGRVNDLFEKLDSRPRITARAEKKAVSAE